MASTSLTWTPSSAGSQQKTTLSMWLKKSKPDNAGYIFEVSDGSNQFVIRESNAQIKFWHFAGSSYDWEAEISPLLRDTNGWYNFVMSIDTTQSSLADRLKCWLNGVSQTVTFTSGSSNLSQNSNWIFNKNATHRWGRADSSYWDGIMSHIIQTDGYCYDASTFGQTDGSTGEWSINPSPTIANYGTNGYWILKDGNSVTDQSPNTNNFTVATGTLTKSEDNPSNIFATGNPLARYANNLTYSNGNTSISSGSGWYMGSATLGASTGKYYYEYKITTLGTGNGFHKIGFISDQAHSSSAGHPAVGALDGGYAFYCQNGNLEVRTDDAVISGYSNSDLGVSFSNNDYMCLAIDMDNKRAYFRKNGDAWIKSADPVNGTNGLDISSDYPTGSTKAMIPAFGIYYNGTGQLNFGNGYFGTTAVSSAGTNASGNGIFEYDVPTGYTALSTKGLNL